MSLATPDPLSSHQHTLLQAGRTYSSPQDLQHAQSPWLRFGRDVGKHQQQSGNPEHSSSSSPAQPGAQLVALGDPEQQGFSPKGEQAEMRA